MSNHTPVSISECVLKDLMPCEMVDITQKEMKICCTIHGKEESICADYSGVSIGSTATYTTSDHFCIDTDPKRTCTKGLTWSGVTPNVTEGWFTSNHTC